MTKARNYAEKQTAPIAVNDRGRRIGEGHHRARYSDAQILRVLELRDAGGSLGWIARQTGVNRATVAAIVNGRIRCQTPATYKPLPTITGVLRLTPGRPAGKHWRGIASVWQCPYRVKRVSEEG